MAALAQWDAFAAWAAGIGAGAATGALDETRPRPAVPRPAKVFAIGLNYKSHAAGGGAAAARGSRWCSPSSRTAWSARAPTSCCRRAYVDWEVELVVVIGRRGRDVREARAFEYVAGYCVGQDISDRKLQFSDQPPQFSHGQVDRHVRADRARRRVARRRSPTRTTSQLTCDVAGERMQDARTQRHDLLGPAAGRLSVRGCARSSPATSSSPARPAGVGSARDPRRYLQARARRSSARSRASGRSRIAASAA